MITFAFLIGLYWASLKIWQPNDRFSIKHLETPYTHLIFCILLGPSGMIGVTTNHRSFSIWTNSRYLCGELLTEIDEQRINHRASSDTKHKEEGEGRIKSDYEDWSKIKTELEKCIHSLEVKSHASNVLVNIYTREESDKSTNVYKAAELGEEQMQQFKKGFQIVSETHWQPKWYLWHWQRTRISKRKIKKIRTILI